MIGLVYLIRSVYSIIYIKDGLTFFSNVIFDEIVFTNFCNLILDLVSIFVVLILNRKTIKLRKFLAQKQNEKDQDLTKRHIAASNELLGRENNPDDDINEEVQTLDRTSRSSSAVRFAGNQPTSPESNNNAVEDQQLQMIL